MPIHIGTIDSRVTVAGRESGVVEMVLDLVLERLRETEPPTMEETIIRDRLTTEG